MWAGGTSLGKNVGLVLYYRAEQIAHAEWELAITLQEFTSDPDGTHDLIVTRPWLSGCHQTISEIRKSTVVAGYQVPGYGTVGEMYKLNYATTTRAKFPY